MVRFCFSFFVVLIVDRVYISIERAYKRALFFFFFFFFFFSCVSPYFFSTKGEERERKRERKHKRGQKKRAKNLFLPRAIFLSCFFSFGEEKKKGKKKRERERNIPLLLFFRRSS